MDVQISNEEYQQYKPLLFSIGYRMLGSVAEAEDLVQETFLKAFQIDVEKIENKKAYFCKIMTNKCLDVLKSSRYKREHYIGTWNPEPLFSEKRLELDPSELFLQKEGISIAYLRMMEYLTPDERIVLLLRKVLDFPYATISEILHKKVENCRKLFSRAMQKIAKVEGESLDYQKNKSVVDRFIQAFQNQQTETLLELISENVTLYSDGGGKVKAALRPITSFPSCLAFFNGIIKKATGDIGLEISNINHQPAIVIYMNGFLYGIISFYIVQDQINEFYMTINPDKLPVG